MTIETQLTILSRSSVNARFPLIVPRIEIATLEKPDFHEASNDDSFEILHVKRDFRISDGKENFVESWPVV